MMWILTLWLLLGIYAATLLIQFYSKPPSVKGWAIFVAVIVGGPISVVVVLMYMVLGILWHIIRNGTNYTGDDYERNN